MIYVLLVVIAVAALATMILCHPLTNPFIRSNVEEVEDSLRPFSFRNQPMHMQRVLIPCYMKRGQQGMTMIVIDGDTLPFEFFDTELLDANREPFTSELPDDTETRGFVKARWLRYTLCKGEVELPNGAKIYFYPHDLVADPCTKCDPLRKAGVR